MSTSACERCGSPSVDGPGEICERCEDRVLDGMFSDVFDGMEEEFS